MSVISHVGRTEAEILRSTLLSVDPTVPELLLRRGEESTEKEREITTRYPVIPLVEEWADVHLGPHCGAPSGSVRGYGPLSGGLCVFLEFLLQ